MSNLLFKNLHGALPALPTPFLDVSDYPIDYNAFEKLIERHISEGSKGLVAVGTTGESPTLDFEEHFAVIKKTVEINNQRLPVIAGTGANATKEAIDITSQAEKLGANIALIVAPYYNKPTQEGLYHHFKMIHDATRIPILLYNVPGRTVADILPETVAKLAELPRIIGIKEATGIMERISDIRLKTPEDFIILSGEDGSMLGAAAHGASGCISVTANVAPKLCAQFHSYLSDGNFVQARKLHDMLFPLHKALFMAPNPVPVKAALGLMGIISDAVRPPLVKVNADFKENLKPILDNLGLL